MCKESIWEKLSKVKDPRRAEGKRYKLENILRLMVSGMLCGCNNVAEVLRWGKLLTKRHREELGFSERLPCHASLSNLFRKLEEKWIEEALSEALEEEEAQLHVALDGKTLRASATPETPAVHLLSLFAGRLNTVIAQEKQAPGTNEITTAINLLKRKEIKGKIISGDAIFAQKKYM